MIRNAKDIPLLSSTGTLPNMGSTLLDWFQPMTLTKITKVVVDHQVSENEQEYRGMGVRQPMNAQEVQMKPEGQRSWSWNTFHCSPDIVMNGDEVFLYMGVRYRVMEKWDWKEYGYLEYHAVQDYVKAVP